jgi:hypothetical protein
MYLETGDPDRRVTDFASNTTAARGYFPVWLNCMADDVTLEGTMMSGAVTVKSAALRSDVVLTRNGRAWGKGTSPLRHVGAQRG